MYLPHPLWRHTSGVFHFRLVVPADLRQAFGKKIIKVSGVVGITTSADGTTAQQIYVK